MAAQYNVSDLCAEHKLSPEALADKIGLDAKSVLAIVMGRRTPSPEERDKVAGAFGLSRDEIIWGHKTPIQHIYGF